MTEQQPGLTKQQLIEALQTERVKRGGNQFEWHAFNTAINLAHQLTEPSPAPCERSALRHIQGLIASLERELTPAEDNYLRIVTEALEFGKFNPSSAKE